MESKILRSFLTSEIALSTASEAWFPGRHEAIVTEEEWRVANRGFVPGRRRSSDPLSGKVRCGLCERRMAVAQNGQGSVSYKCRHRGSGCALPARSNQGLACAALFGMEQLSRDERLQAAVRRQLSGGRRTRPEGAGRRRRQDAATAMAALSERRRKVLDLYVAGKICADGFQEERSGSVRSRPLGHRPRASTRRVDPGRTLSCDLSRSWQRSRNSIYRASGPRRTTTNVGSHRGAARVGDRVPGSLGGHGRRHSPAQRPFRGGWT